MVHPKFKMFTGIKKAPFENKETLLLVRGRGFILEKFFLPDSVFSRSAGKTKKVKSAFWSINAANQQKHMSMEGRATRSSICSNRDQGPPLHETKVFKRYS